MKVVLILSLCLIKIMGNLVLGGNFESETGALINWRSQYKLRFKIVANSCGWYSPLNVGLLVTNHTNVLTTYCVNIRPYQYRICQKFSFVAGSPYQLRYDLYNPFFIAHANVTVTLDQTNNISSFFLNGSNIFGNHYFEFVAPRSGFYSLCFSSQNIFAPPYTLMAARVFTTTYMDNISLIGPNALDPATIPTTYSSGCIDNTTNNITNNIINNSTINPINPSTLELIFIQFIPTKILQRDSQIILTGNQTYNQQIGQILISQYLIAASGEIFDTYQVFGDNDNFMSILLKPNFSFSLTELQFQQFNQTINITTDRNVQFFVNIRKLNKYFYKLTSTHNKYLAQFQGVCLILIKIAMGIIGFMKISFSSYYVLALICFDTLTPLYIFLHINTVPEFTKYVYKQILQIQYELLSIPNIIRQIFNLSYTPFQVQFQTAIIPQMISKEKDYESWVGEYGFTSLFMKNNTLNFAFLVILLFKSFLTSKTAKWLKKSAPKYFSTQIKLKVFVIVFMIEFISMSPSFIISALARIQNPCISWTETFQKISHIIVMFFVISSMAIYFVQSLNARAAQRSKQRQKMVKNKQNQAKKQIEKQVVEKVKVYNSQQNKVTNIFQDNKPLQILQIAELSEFVQTQRIPKKTKITKQKGKTRQFYILTSDIIIFYTIPFFLFGFDTPIIFFVLNSFAIIVKVTGYFLSLKSRNLLQNIIELLINMVWVTHHICFGILFILSRSNSNYSQIFVSYSTLILYLGFILILTVLTGSFLETSKIVIQVIKAIFFCCKFIKFVCQQKIEECNKQRQSIQDKINQTEQAQKQQNNKCFIKSNIQDSTRPTLSAKGQNNKKATNKTELKCNYFLETEEQMIKQIHQIQQIEQIRVEKVQKLQRKGQ